MSLSFKTIITVGLLLFCHYLSAQHIVSGTVRDSTEIPIPGASIRIVPLKNGTMNDTSGNYRLTLQPASSYLLKLDALRLNSITQTIPQPGSYDFVLKPKVGQLQQGIIKDASQGITISKTPLAMAVVSKRNGPKYNSKPIDAVMKIMPGVSAVTTGPNVSKPDIRGLGYNRVLIGTRQKRQQWGSRKRKKPGWQAGGNQRFCNSGR